jgi:hypothetical protein
VENRDTSKYWDKQFARRIINNIHFKGNWDKYDIIVKELWSKPYLLPLNKLEIGSGLCPVAIRFKELCPSWLEAYTAVEQSKVAVEWVKRNGIDAYCSCIMDFNSEKKFEVFMMFDVLEHIEDVNALAEKIKSLATEKYRIIGNIPLYSSKHDPEEGFERLMNIDVLNEDMAEMGCNKITHLIYGSHGWPYMMWEAHN